MTAVPIGVHVLEQRRDRDLAALGLMLFASWNLNGVLALLFNTEALLSPLVLCCAIILLLRYARPQQLSGVYFLYIGFLISYLLFATLFNKGRDNPGSYVFQQYLSTIVFVTSLYFWLSGCTNLELDIILKRFKVILITAAALVPLSPFLAAYIPYTRPENRASGLFDNPGEASSAALYCLVLLVGYPARYRLVTLVQVCIVVIAVVVTFSKAGLICLTLLTLMILIRQRSLSLTLLAICLFAIGSFALPYALNSDLLHLDSDQRDRLEDVLSLFEGEISRRATTGRADLWELGLRIIKENLPWGTGLGTFHALEGGRRVPHLEALGVSRWLGVHNTYLTVLGEAGIIPFVLMIGFLAGLVVLASRARESFVALGFILVFIIDMFSIHNALYLRLPNLIMAITIAIAARSFSTASRAGSGNLDNGLSGVSA